MFSGQNQILNHISAYFADMDINFNIWLILFNFPPPKNNTSVLFEFVWVLELLITVFAFFRLCFFFNMRIISVQLESRQLVELLVTVLSFHILPFMNTNTISVRFEPAWPPKILVTVLSYCWLWRFLLWLLIDWRMYIAVQFEFRYSLEILVIAFHSYCSILQLLNLYLVYFFLA